MIRVVQKSWRRLWFKRWRKKKQLLLRFEFNATLNDLKRNLRQRNATALLLMRPGAFDYVASLEVPVISRSHTTAPRAGFSFTVLENTILIELDSAREWVVHKLLKCLAWRRRLKSILLLADVALLKTDYSKVQHEWCRVIQSVRARTRSTIAVNIALLNLSSFDGLSAYAKKTYKQENIGFNFESSSPAEELALFLSQQVALLLTTRNKVLLDAVDTLEAVDRYLLPSTVSFVQFNLLQVMEAVLTDERRLQFKCSRFFVTDVNEVYLKKQVQDVLSKCSPIYYLRYLAPSAFLLAGLFLSLFCFKQYTLVSGVYDQLNLSLSTSMLIKNVRVNDVAFWPLKSATQLMWPLRRYQLVHDYLPWLLNDTSFKLQQVPRKSLVLYHDLKLYQRLAHPRQFTSEQGFSTKTKSLLGFIQPQTIDAHVLQQAQALLDKVPIYLLLWYIIRDSNRIKALNMVPQVSIFNRGHAQALPGVFLPAGYHEFEGAWSQQLAILNKESWLFGPVIRQKLKLIDINRLHRQLNAKYWHLNEIAWVKVLASIEIRSFNTIDDAISTLSDFSMPSSGVNVLVGKMLKYQSLYKSHWFSNDPAIQLHQANKSLKLFYRNHSKEKQLASIVKPLISFLTQIASADNEGKASYMALKKMLKENKSIFHLVAKQGQGLPAPYNRWIRELSFQSENLIIRLTGQYLLHEYQLRLQGFYQEKIRPFYPFNQHSSQETSWADFTRFYGVKGLQMQFINRYLRPFIEITDNGELIEKSVGIAQMSFPMKLNKAISLGQLVRQKLLNKQSRLFLMPLALSPTISIVTFEIGKGRVSFFHGPKELIKLKWPNPLTPGINISWFDQQNSRHEKQFKGVFGLFRLFGLSLSDLKEGGKKRLILGGGSIRIALSFGGT